MQRKIKDAKLPDRRERPRKAKQSALHYPVVQNLVFAVEHGLSVLTFLQRNSGPPDKRFVLAFRCGKRIAKTFDRVGMRKYQINRESDLQPLDNFVEASPKYLGHLL